jgi:hypothetical protein
MKIEFEIETEFGMYRDALHLPDGATYSDPEIAVMKQQRVDAWIELMRNPPVAEENPVVKEEPAQE